MARKIENKRVVGIIFGYYQNDITVDLKIILNLHLKLYKI